jgi:hypothetical protein
MKPSEDCIFCGSTAKLKQEHIFGKWMKRNIKSTKTKTAHLTSFVDLDRQTGAQIPSMAKGKLNRPGSPHSHQLHLVCNNCNNIWMGSLQENAKPHVLALAKSDWSGLTLQSMTDLAAWATMVTICIEFADLNTQSVSKSERKIFRGIRRPGPNWIVCFGRCGDFEDPGAFWHRAGSLYDPSGPLDAVPDKPNTQATTVYVGQCFFHTLSGPADVLPDPGGYAVDLGIRQFWRLPTYVPTMPRVFTRAGVDRVATKFWADFGISAEPHFGLMVK